jgi:Ca2+-binding EF-hand superfamily protein
MLKMKVRAGLAAGFGLLAMAGTVLAQNPNQPGARPAQGRNAQHAQNEGSAAQNRPAGDTPGPIDSVRDLQDTAKMLFKLVDLNNDGLISRQEAIDAGNVMVGGFFFDADANGDGKIATDEMRAVRERLMQQKPVLKAVLRAAREQTKQENRNRSGREGQKESPIAMMAGLFDERSEREVQARDVRAAVQAVVESFYDVADTNHDGQMSPVELNAAAIGIARAAAQTAFEQTDTDNNGKVSEQEFDRALQEPLHLAFRTIDTDNDGQISKEEAKKAQQVLIEQIKALRIPDAPNSLPNLIRSGQKPESVAPVPSFTDTNVRTTRAPSR